MSRHCNYVTISGAVKGKLWKDIKKRRSVKGRPRKKSDQSTYSPNQW